MPVKIAFRPIIQTIITLLRDDPSVADVDVEVAGGDTVLTADPELLKLALHNLLVNSAQAMNGHGRIVVSAGPAPGGGEIRVHDEGPGIPPDVREQVFEPFFTTKHRGTGLGLATARRLVEAHGGTLDLVCPPEGGTTAILRLPHLPVKP